ELIQNYLEFRKPDDPETLDDYFAKVGHPAGRTSAAAMQTVIDNQGLGAQLNRMRWSTVSFPTSKFDLLTSDRPIIMTNGLRGSRDHLALPMGPRLLFL